MGESQAMVSTGSSRALCRGLVTATTWWRSFQELAVLARSDWVLCTRWHFMSGTLMLTSHDSPSHRCQAASYVSNTTQGTLHLEWLQRLWSKLRHCNLHRLNSSLR